MPDAAKLANPGSVKEFFEGYVELEAEELYAGLELHTERIRAKVAAYIRAHPDRFVTHARP